MGLERRIVHPCLGCGACCASFRVAFYWLESEPGTEPQVPPELTNDLNLSQRCMKGTDAKHHPKCMALSGRIGRDAHCSIYESRPTPCRRFEASYEDGQRNSRCDEARVRHGLQPLTKQDWKNLEPTSIDVGLGRQFD